MSNVVFELFAKLGLDSSEYEKGLGNAKSLAGSVGGAIGKGFKTMAAIGTAAIGTATAAATAFAGTAVKVGAEFDSSMSQIAATLGLTMEDIKSNANGAGDTFDALREKAREMGGSTIYSATESAEALNILAMSGYSAEESIGMVEDVLHLAAAGSMDMAQAASYVSGAMKGFNDETKDSAYYADMMAKGATLANTSVSQLGEAMSGGAASAAAYNQSADSMTIALLRLAEQGETGSAAGTALAAAMKDLYTGTDQAKAALKELGVEAYDPITKEAKDFNQVVNELEASMQGMTDEEKNNYKQTIFGIQGLNAYNKMVVTGIDKQEEWANAIANSSGEASKQYDTMTDNLEGAVKGWNSALDDFRIEISDQITPALTDFVKFGTGGLQDITKAFQEGGLSGAMDAFGSILTDGIAMITEMLPDAINAGMELLGAVGQGLLDNLPAILDAATQIITMLGQGLITALPALLQGAIQIIKQLGTYLIENIPTLIPAIISLVNEMVLMLVENAPALVNGAIALLTGLATALFENAPTLIPAIVQLVVAIATALIENLPTLVQAVIDINIALVQAIIENAPLFLDACVQILVAIVNLIVEYGGQFLTAMGEALTNLVANVGTGLGEMYNTFILWLSQLPTQMAYYAGYAIGEFIKFVQQLPTKVSQIFTNVMTKVTTFGTNFINKATEMAKNFFNNLVNGIKELPSRMVQFGNDLVNAIANLPSRFAEIGSNIVQGIWNGISDGWEWLTDSVANLADSLLQGVKDALGIESPSKEFAYVGRMVDEGFAKGLNDYSHLIDNALNDIISLPSIDNMVGDLSINSSGGTNGNGYTQILNITSPVALTPYEVARQARNATRDMVLAMSM